MRQELSINKHWQYQMLCFIKANRGKISPLILFHVSHLSDKRRMVCGSVGGSVCVVGKVGNHCFSGAEMVSIFFKVCFPLNKECGEGNSLKVNGFLLSAFSKCLLASNMWDLTAAADYITSVDRSIMSNFESLGRGKMVMLNTGESCLPIHRL